MTNTLSREEKERILKTIEEDREFRYALMGLLGFREILDRITRLEERQQRLEERQQKLEERMVKLEERQQKLEERMVRLEERQQKLEERMIKLEERQQKLEEELIRVRRLAELNRRDLGALTESLYTRWVFEDLKEEIKGFGERVVRRVRNFVIDNREIDLLIESDKKIYVVEIKIQPNHHDIEELVEKKELVKKKFKKETVAVLAGVWIGDEVQRYAIEKNVKIYVY